MADMAQEAEQKGANGVLGISFDYEAVRGSMLFVGCTGTAVVLEEREG